MPHPTTLNPYSHDFQHAVAFVLAKEGGYVNHPKDPGGETNFGISKRAYPREDIANLTKERAAFLYHRDYWRPVRCHELPGGVALAVFDGAVQHGTGTAARLLQEILGVNTDGIIGPISLRAARQADAEWLTARYVLRRARLYARIQAKDPAQSAFIEGWFNRLRDLTDASWQLGYSTTRAA
ncbi:glycoside hydrolase family 108 protein [Alkalimonas mucilaginosa]|uniref:Glycosyl hydrolase 108 family protein n=1 Tax=Alkalimonas mucilaginosa TaxID=3057676 RepID=A0ABU7JH89_9GAMM|nr:glycosyl hydrolase 108 family protein [Alkalimonas sp. MEB004]MEE2025047.1 glycosyl hydrolase 108 family protein [Alkalimonas sp. MEB004]